MFVFARKMSQAYFGIISNRIFAILLILFLYLFTRYCDVVSAGNKSLYSSDTKQQIVSDFPAYTAVAWSPRGTILAVGATTGIWLYTKNFSPVAYFKGEEKDVSDIIYPSYLSWSADETKLIGSGKNAYVWDVKIGSVIKSYSSPAPDFFTSIAMCRDGTSVANANAGGKVWLWDAVTGQDLLTLNYSGTGPAVNLLWNDNCSQLIIGGPGMNIQVWDIHPLKLRTELKGTVGLYSFAASPDGKTLAIGYPYHSWDPETVTFWDAVTSKQLFSFDNDQAVVWAIAWSPDGKKLATSDEQGNLIIWDFASHRILAKLQSGPREQFLSYPNALSWSPDGSELVSASDDNTVRVYNMHTYKLITIFSGDGSF